MWVGFKNGFYFRFAVTPSSYEMRGLSGSAGSSANAVSVGGAGGSLQKRAAREGFVANLLLQ